MGFRNYNPSVARFQSRDMYSDAAQDMGLSMDLATNSRYTFAGGNPVTFSELDGHRQDEGANFRVPKKETKTHDWREEQLLKRKLAKKKKDPAPTPGPGPKTVNTSGNSGSNKNNGSGSSSNSGFNWKNRCVGCGGTSLKPEPPPPIVALYGLISTSGHSILSWGGLIPALGILPDLLDSGWYALEGDFVNAGISGLAAIPGAGQGVTAGRWGVKATQAAKSCFVAGTKILTNLGEKVIEEIREGDRVLSKDEKTGEVSYKEVKTVFQREVAETYELTIGDEVIETTAEHPFWVVESGWKKVKDLSKGDLLITSSGDTLRLEKITIKTESTMVFNIEVADYHTYFVSNLHIFVHNKAKGNKLPWVGNGGTPARIPKASETILKNFQNTKIPRVKDAAVYQNGNKFYHLDTMHTGVGAHLEVYNKKGNHLGKADSVSGELIPGTAVKGRRLPK